MGEESATSQFRFASELERVFASAEFARSPVMRRLLRFLVDQTLAGKGDQLKAYSVAVDGLGRDPDFDAQTDSYPRVQVGRLRRMLDAYYARSGIVSGERLVIPNGAYRVFLHPVYRKPERPAAPVNPMAATPLSYGGTEAGRPDFTAMLMGTAYRTSRKRYRGVIIALLAVLLVLSMIYLATKGTLLSRPEVAAAPLSAPELLLLPVESSANSPASLAPSIDQVLGDALHRSWVVKVPSANGRRREKEYAYRLQSALAGPTGEDLYLTLWNNRTGERIWTGQAQLSGQEFAVQERLRLPIANLIGSFGVIATDQRQAYGERIDPGYPCLLKNAELRMRLEKGELAVARRCLAQTLAVTPDSPSALAASADISYRVALANPRQAGTLKALAQDKAKQALLLDPYSAQAQMASATSAFVNGNCLSGKVQGLRAVDLNPYEAEYQARLGMQLFQCGNPDYEGYLTAAREMYPALPAFFTMPVIAAMGERGEGAAAIRLALSLPSSTSPYYPITMAIAYAYGGDRARARSYWRQFTGDKGNDATAPQDLLKKVMVNPGMIRATGNALLKSGVVDRLD